MLPAAGASPRGVPGCWKEDEHRSICGGAAAEAPGDMAGKRRLALPCSSGQDCLPCSSYAGSFLIFWNALHLDKGSFCFFSIVCPKWDSLLLTSRWLFCLLSHLFIHMGLIFDWRSHYPEGKSYCWMGALIYWMLKMMHSVSWNCLKVRAYLRISYKEMYLRWLLHLLVFFPGELNTNLLTYLEHCHLHFSALTQCVVGEGGTDLPCTVCNLDRNCWWQAERAAVAQPAARHHPGAEKAAFVLRLPRKQLPSCTERRFAQVPGCCWVLELAFFFMSDVNLKGTWAVVTVFWAILEIRSQWTKAAAEPRVTSSTQ